MRHTKERATNTRFASKTDQTVLRGQTGDKYTEQKAWFAPVLNYSGLCSACKSCMQLKQPASNMGEA